MNPLSIPRYLLGLLVDAAFGKAEPFEFTGSTRCEVDKPPHSGHTVT